ncbi:MAG: hypothetical protein ACREIA_11340 [Opitutaceae bacterium]
MRSSRATLEQIADPDNLRAALGKAARSDVIAFRENLAGSLAALRTGRRPALRTLTRWETNPGHRAARRR